MCGGKILKSLEIYNTMIRFVGGIDEGSRKKEFVLSLLFLFFSLSINIHRFKVIQLCVIHLFESAEFKGGARFKFEKALTFLKEEHNASKSWKGNIVTVSGHTRIATTCFPPPFSSAQKVLVLRTSIASFFPYSTCTKLPRK